VSSLLASVGLEILLILVLIVANGVFSGSEIAIVSARRVRLEQMANQGNRRAAVALRLATSPNDLLSTVQIGITLIGILSGAVGGATLSGRLKPLLDAIPPLRPWSEPLSLALVVSAITYLSLVIGELVPKRIALNNPEAIACAVARPMRWLSRWGAPLVHLLGSSTDALLRLLGVPIERELDLTEEEIRALIRQGAEAGVLEEAEHEMVQRVFHLADRPVRAIMTPRTEIDWLDLEESDDSQLAEVLASGHSRLPVGRGHLDDCVGIVRSHALLAAHLEQDTVEISALLEKPLYITETAGTLAVIGQFRENGVEIALVTDEYGGIEGLVTLTDLMEAIVGDLPSGEQEQEPAIRRRDDGSWLIDAALPLEALRELLQRQTLPGEDVGGFHTLAGFLLHRFGRVPAAGDHFSWDGWRFEVVDMDGHRIDKVLIGPQERPSAD
jgi:putative hemolysin